jgi:hypothetical protein
MTIRRFPSDLTMGIKQTVAEHIDKRVYRDPNSGCWLWLGRVDEKGYARGGNKSYPGESKAHRLSYLYHVGPIPEGLELDHLCRVRSCVNPSHLEAVTHAENCRRGDYKTNSSNGKKTHCPSGHEYTPANTILQQKKGGAGRKCRACRDSRNRSRYQRDK